MARVNLFEYATSELSQDAFICWLLAHGKKEHQGEDPLLTACALDFIHKVRGLEHATEIDAVEKQYLNIDVLVKVGDIYVIIEDKTYTNVHDDQINVYTESLIKEGKPKENIRTVFYKIVEQSSEEKVDRAFTRADMLELLRKYKDCTNDIFQDYFTHLEKIERETMIFKTKPINEWSNAGTRGFFAHLQEKHEDYHIGGWDYVSNASGGFMGMWFHRLDNETTLKAMGIYEHIEDIYLQFENDTAFSGSKEEAEKAAAYILAVKVRANSDDKERDNYRKASEIRRDLYEAIQEKIPAFAKKTFRPGVYMTVGYLPYNKENYENQVHTIKNALDAIVKEWSQRQSP